MERRKTPEDIVSKSCWAWRNITLGRGWSPISSLVILIRQALFWPADMHTIHAREWCKPGLKRVTLWPVWLVQTPGWLITHTPQDFDTISSEVFLFSPFFACQEKPLLSGYVCIKLVKKKHFWSNNHLNSVWSSSIWLKIFSFLPLILRAKILQSTLTNETHFLSMCRCHCVDVKQGLPYKNQLLDFVKQSCL